MSELLRPQPVPSAETIREEDRQETIKTLGLIMLVTLNPAFVIHESLPLALQPEIVAGQPQQPEQTGNVVYLDEYRKKKEERVAV